MLAFGFLKIARHDARSRIRAAAFSAHPGQSLVLVRLGTVPSSRTRALFRSFFPAGQMKAFAVASKVKSARVGFEAIRLMQVVQMTIEHAGHFLPVSRRPLRSRAELVHLSHHSMVCLREGLQLPGTSGIRPCGKSSARVVVVVRRASRSSITARWIRDTSSSVVAVSI